MTRRRANNEGSVYRLADGKGYRGYISLDGGGRKYFSGKTMAAVNKKIKDARANLDAGLPVGGPDQTLAEYLGSWLKDVAAGRVDARTLRDYSGLVRLHIAPDLGRLKIDRVTPQVLGALYAKKLASGLSARRVYYIHQVLHTALRQAVQWNLIARNPCDAASAPRPGRREIKPLSADEAQRFFDAVEGDDLAALHILALTTGMRQSELLGLSWADIDLKSGRLQVRHALQRLDGKWTLKEPKTAGSRHSIKLSSFALTALHRHRAKQLEARLKAGSEWEVSDLVFTTCLGRPLHGKYVLDGSFRPLLRKAGLADRRFHDLRHTAASLLLAEGRHPKEVQDLLGHSTITLTMDTYSHLAPHLQDEVANTMDALFGPRRESRQE